jgi:IS30 family transposase
LSRTGGIHPPKRIRSSLSLTLSKREDVSRGLAASLLIREIAAQLRRSPSTVSREINRNVGYYNYRVTDADQAVRDRALRAKLCKLVYNIAGSKNSYIATLVERHSRDVMSTKIKHNDAETIVTALIKQSKKLPDELYKSLRRAFDPHQFLLTQNSRHLKCH